jgi:hypothetical protein
MKVYILIYQEDCDPSTDIIAVFSTEELANEHADIQSIEDVERNFNIYPHLRELGEYSCRVKIAREHYRIEEMEVDSCA